MYRKLIETICSTLTGSDNSRPDLTLVPIYDAMHLDARGKPISSTFELPDAMLPTSFQARPLPADETFLDEAESLLRSVSPGTVFAIPPWIHHRHLSQNFKNAHSHLGLIEAFAEQAFTSPPQATADELEMGDSRPTLRTKSLELLILFVPRSILHSMKQGRWRTQFFPMHSATVIEHDHGLDVPGFELPFHRLFRAATLVMQAQPGPLRFFKITEEMVSGSTEQLLEDLCALLKRKGGATKFGYVHRGELKSDYPVTYDFYSPATQALREGVQDLSVKVSLDEVADVLTGLNRYTTGVGEPSNERFQAITGRNIMADGNFDFSDLSLMRPGLPVQSIGFLEEGDICVRRFRPTGRGTQFTAAVFPGYQKPLAFDNSVIVIRPKPALNEEQRLVLLEFLRSSVARDLFMAKGESVQLRTRVLGEFPVPLADKDLTSAIRGLSEARQAFVEWTAKLDHELSNLVSDRDMAQSRLNILSAGRLARQRYRAARQAEDLDYRIRTQYPLPLAYLWREWQVSSPNPYLELRNILKAGEGICCFFALVAILVSRSCGVKIGYLKTIASRLAKRGGGTNFGDWYSILEEVGKSKTFRQLGSEVPFFEVTELMRSDNFKKSLQLLMATRNDDSHGRISPRSVSRKLLRELGAALKKVYTEAGFVGDYRLLQITLARFDSIRRETNYHYADLTGDNPLVPKRKAVTNCSELEVDSLYLRDRQEQLHLFRPLLHYLECPECHLMSIFYLDTYSGSGSKVSLKSFERSSVREEEIADQFQWVGLLSKEDNREK